MAEALSDEFLRNQVPLKDQATFKFYYGQTAGETLPVAPEYTWDQFAQRGYAPFEESEGYTLASFDKVAGDLIPNYWEASGEFPAMLDAFKGETAELIHAYTDLGNAAIINASHPSLPSPLLATRALIEALGPEVRKRLFIVYGLFPTIFKYDIGGEFLSPVSSARSLGNVMLTAARTPSNDATGKDTAAEIERSQHSYRDTFKTVFDTETSPKNDGDKGAIVVLCVTGQRIKHGPVLRPDGSLDYLHGRRVWNVGIEDNLFGPEIKSHVWMRTDPNHIDVTKNNDVHHSNRETCRLASHGNTIFTYETRSAHTKRLALSGMLPKFRPTKRGNLQLG